MLDDLGQRWESDGPVTFDRWTFVIDPDGKVAYKNTKVRPGPGQPAGAGVHQRTSVIEVALHLLGETLTALTIPLKLERKRRSESHSLTLRLTMAQMPASLPSPSAADWPMLGRDATRNAVSPEPNPPTRWNAEVLPSRWEKGKVVESVPGSSNVQMGRRTRVAHARRRPGRLRRTGVGRDATTSASTARQTPDASVLACFRESDGRPLYRYVSPRLPGACA